MPDDNFEQELINLGVDWVFDDYVETAGIDTITYLYIPSNSIADLTGIKDFTALRELYCYSNQLTFLDLSNNSQLFEVSCGNNQLASIDLRNGNNTVMSTSSTFFNLNNNPNLYCIEVNNINYANNNWTFANGSIDNQHYFNTNCSGTGIKEYTTYKELIKTIDILGQKTHFKKKEVLFYIYDDGTVEKKIFIE